MIYFIGPLPPPLHGFSAINNAMLNLMQERTRVLVFNLTPKSSGLYRLFSVFYLFFFILGKFIFKCIAQPPTAVYLGLSGGYRQLIDIFFVIVARVLSIPVFVHHHSFAYLNASPWVSRLAMYFLSVSDHIVLCEEMSSRLVLRYGVDVKKIHVLSNAAFLPAPQIDSLKLHVASDVLRVGFLSNITTAKGIFDYFDLMDAVHAAGLNVDGFIAGPVDAAIEKAFSERLVALPRVKHVGPVYGEMKESFFQNLDLLAFPTRYVNEAEPVTILEALSHGVSVVAVQRGCIECMLPSTAGISVADISGFVNVATQEIGRCVEVPGYLEDRRAGAFSHFTDQYAEHASRIDILLKRICNPHSTSYLS